MKTKNIIIYIVIAILLVGGTFLVTKSVYQENNTKKNVEKGLEPGKLSELKAYTGEIPDFNIPILGNYTGSFTDEDLKSSGIKVYEFKGCVKYSWGSVEHDYVGIKFKDFLDYTHMSDYEKIEFNDYNYLTITYSKEEITDDAYLILQRNGGQMVSPFVGFLDFNYQYNYSVEGVLSMVFK